jgi:hypothetical protein
MPGKRRGRKRPQGDPFWGVVAGISTGLAEVEATSGRRTTANGLAFVAVWATWMFALPRVRYVWQRRNVAALDEFLSRPRTRVVIVVVLAFLILWRWAPPTTATALGRIVSWLAIAVGCVTTFSYDRGDRFPSRDVSGSTVT